MIEGFDFNVCYASGSWLLRPRSHYSQRYLFVVEGPAKEASNKQTVLHSSKTVVLGPQELSEGWKVVVDPCKEVLEAFSH